MLQTTSAKEKIRRLFINKINNKEKATPNEVAKK